MSGKGGDKQEKLHRIYEMEGRNTSSTDPKMMESRLFIGNLASDLVTRQDIENLFGKHGKILGVSLHKSFGFVQFEEKDSAVSAVKEQKGKLLKGLKMDLCIATERRKDPAPSGRGRRPPRSRSRSPRRRREREWERERDRWGGGWFDRRPSPPPPRFRGDPYRDPYFPPPRDDPYYHPRDDPYDRYPPMDPYDRYPPPRGYPRDYPPPPPRRDRYDMDLYDGGDRDPYLRERDRHPPSSLGSREDSLGGGGGGGVGAAGGRGLLPNPSERKTTEMEIIVVSQQQK